MHNWRVRLDCVVAWEWIELWYWNDFYMTFAMFFYEMRRFSLVQLNYWVKYLNNTFRSGGCVFSNFLKTVTISIILYTNNKGKIFLNIAKSKQIVNKTKQFPKDHKARFSPQPNLIPSNNFFIFSLHKLKINILFRKFLLNSSKKQYQTMSV